MKVFVERPALHRYPASMARRVHELTRLVVDSYGGKTENIWRGSRTPPSFLPGSRSCRDSVTKKRASSSALLGKQLGVRPDGWVEKSSPYGEPKSFRSVADIVDGPSLDRVRTTKHRPSKPRRRQSPPKSQRP